MTFQFKRLALAVGLVAVAACGSQQRAPYDSTAGASAEPPAPWQSSQAESPQDMQDMCPAALPQARIEVFDTADGAAIDFTTTSETALPDLERRVSAMANHINEFGLQQGPSTGTAGAGAQTADPDGRATATPGGPAAQPAPGSTSPGAATDDEAGTSGAATDDSSGSAGATGGSTDDSATTGVEGQGSDVTPGGSPSASPGGTPSDSMGSGATGMSHPAIRTSAYPVPNGSRLVFTAMNVSELEIVRTYVRDMAEQMRVTGSCPHLQRSQQQ